MGACHTISWFLNLSYRHCSPLDRSAFLRVKNYIPIDQQCNEISGDQDPAHVGFGVQQTSLQFLLKTHCP
ncbi:hypothetical protein OG21DRAFT_1513720, partial [Imleria badia]